MMYMSINSTPASLNINSFVNPSSVDTLHIEIEVRGQKRPCFSEARISNSTMTWMSRFLWHCYPQWRRVITWM